MIGALLFVCAFALLLSASGANAASYQYQNITTDTTWNQAGSPYILNQSITVQNGVTLTIGPNVIVMADPGVTLTINGSLAVNGVANNVNFTANVTGDYWGGILFNPASHGNLNMAKINNATYGIWGTNATVAVTNVDFRDIGYNAITLKFDHITSSVAITGSKFHNIGIYNVYANVVEIEINSYSTLAYVNATAVPVSITNNRFDLGRDNVAIYVYQYAEARENATATITGNVAVTGNWITSTTPVYTSGMYVMSDAYAYNKGISTVTSNFNLSNNRIGSVLWSIYSERYVYTYDNATGSTTGYVNMIGNSIDDSYQDALYFYTYIDAYQWSSASISGDFTVRSNVVNETGSDGIYLESEAYIYDNATGRLSMISTIDSNRIVYSDADSINLYRNYETYDAFKSSFVGTGNVIVTNNIVNYSYSDAIYLELDVESNGLKTISLTSSYTVTGNIVRYSDHEAMFVDEYIYAYDNTTITYASPINMANNVVNEADWGASIVRAINVYDNGTIICTGNFTVTGNHMGEMSVRGIDVERHINDDEDSDLLLAANATVSLTGSVTITSNDVNTVLSGEGIFEYLQAYSYGYSKVTVTGDLKVSDNNVNQTFYDGGDYYAYGIEIQRGMYLETEYDEYDFPIEAFDHSNLTIVESITVSNNVIVYSEDEAIYVYIWMKSSDNSNVKVTEPVTISGNVIKKTDDDSILFERYIYSYDESKFIIAGDTIIKNNVGLYSSDYGIYVDTYVVSNEDSKMTVSGTVQVLDNNLNAISDEGIWIERFAESYGNSKVVWTGALSVLRNQVVASSYEGIDIEYEGAYANGNSTATLIGGAVISNNTLTVNDDDGIYLSNVGGWSICNVENGASVATYDGNILVADNHITSVNNYYAGIDCYLYVYAVTNGPMGSKWANITMGNLLITRNYINSNGYDATGIYLATDIYSEGSSGGSASTKVGTQIVTKNNIAMQGDSATGIEWYVSDLFSEAADGNASLVAGTISFNDNIVDIAGSYAIGIYAGLDTEYVYALSDSEYYTYDYFGWKAFVNVAGINFADNTITITGEGGRGIWIEGSYTDEETSLISSPVYSIFARAQYGNDVAIFMANTTISGNTIMMKGADCGGIIVSPIDLTVYYWQGSATLIFITNVVDNTVELKDATGTGIFVTLTVESAASSFNGALKLDTTTSVVNNAVTGGGIGINISASTKVFVTSNVIKQTSDIGLMVIGSGAIVEKNTITENAGTGAKFAYNTDTTLFIVIGNNTITDNAGDGLWINDSVNVKMYNGVFTDNSYDGIYVPLGSDVEWIIDAATTVRNNDVYICGNVDIRNGGTLTLDSVNYFTVGEAYNGYTEMKVKVGGSLIVLNSRLYSDNGAGQFLVYGNLQMMSSAEYEWSQIYLANTSTAKITASTIANNDRNGIYIDGCDPTISSSTIALNGMDGIYIDAGSAPLIKSCHIALNQRGIYAKNANLDNVVDNIFLLNYVAGIYTDGVVGKIHANTFLLDKNEIFVYDSVVSIEDNQIGYASQVDQLVKYSTVLSLILSYVDTKSITADMFGSSDDGLLGSSASSSFDSFMSSMRGTLSDMLPTLTGILLEHVGLYAVNSDVIAKDNTYGLLTYAVYAENSNISFSDSVQNNVIVMEWLNSNLDSRSITIPTYVYNGIYMIDSKLIMDGANIQCVNDAVFLDHSNAVITNSVLNASRFDIYSIHGSNVSVSMTTFDGKLKVEDAGWITFLNQFTIIVKDGDGKLVSGAPVTVVDGNGKLIASGNTSANGEFHADVIGWIQTASGKQTVSTPYWVNATVGGKTISQTADGSQSQTITAQAEKNPMDAVWLPLLLIIALIVVVVVIMVVMRSRKN